MVVNLDFTGATQSFVGTNAKFDATTLTNWLGTCGSPVNTYLVPFNLGGRNTPCGDIAIVTDGSTKALKLTYTVADYNAAVGTAGVVTNTGGPGSVVLPQSIYVEPLVRTDSTTINSRAASTDIFQEYNPHFVGWLWQGSQAANVEADLAECFGNYGASTHTACGIGNVAYDSNAGCCATFAYNYQSPSMDQTVYNVIGERVTTDLSER